MSAAPRHYPRLSNAPINDDVETPPALFDDLHQRISFTYDPTPLQGATTPGVPDALSTPLGYTTFANPPYSNLDVWLAFHAAQWELHGSRSVMLVPHHPETQYWFQSVVFRASMVWQCVTGLRFRNYDKKFALPMALVFYGDFTDTLGQLDTGATELLGDNLWYVLVLPRGRRFLDRRKRLLGGPDVGGRDLGLAAGEQLPVDQ